MTSPTHRFAVRLSPCSTLTSLLFALLLAGCAAVPRGGDESAVPLWGRWEEAFSAQAPAGQETVLTVTLVTPGGETRTVDGFWDGGALWKVRVLADEEGTWRFRTASVPRIAGLDGREGSFVVRGAAVNDDSPLVRHGALGISADARHLAHADGTPFFWLGDTGWNGALKSSTEDWATYLADRKDKRFSVIQFVTTQWRTALTDAEGQVAYTGHDDIRINPEFFRRMDERVDAVNRAGLLAAPVLLWTLGDTAHSPGKLPEDQAVRLARYLVARYQGNHVVWILAGDENFERNGERWRRIGRAVFDRPGHAPVTLHPQGMQWHFEPLRGEPWLSFLIYQSGHGDDAKTLEWLHSGPVTRAWRAEPAMPIINSEPPYEDHIAYQSRKPHSAYSVRRAVYWSLLNAPTAGVTYGGHGIWSWETEPAVPLNHANTGIARPWHQALNLPGGRQMAHVAALFTSLDWWRLRPEPALVLEQSDDPSRFVGSAATDAGDLAVLYLPVGGTVRLDPARVPAGGRAEWFDPREGGSRPAAPSAPGVFTAPDAQDWALVLR